MTHIASRRACSLCTMRTKKDGTLGHFYACPLRKAQVARDMRERRAAEGLCACCGGRPEVGFRTCAVQRARVRSALSRYRRRQNEKEPLVAA